jgi:shikimate dehydrogenase
MISGSTELIAHLGYPTQTFKSSRIFNPWFDRRGIDAVVVPMGVRPEHYPAFFRSLFTLTNVRGALVTMPHKMTTMALADSVSPGAAIAGATNAVRVQEDGTLFADQFDGAGFVKGALRQGFEPTGKRALVIGNGGVGSSIAASLAGAGVSAIGLIDPHTDVSSALAGRIRTHHPGIDVTIGHADPAGYDMVVNATPLGMRDGDPLPVDVKGLRQGTFVGDVVLSESSTPFAQAARDRGCVVQVGSDMLFEMIPAMLSFFGFGESTPEELRATAELP